MGNLLETRKKQQPLATPKQLARSLASLGTEVTAFMARERIRPHLGIIRSDANEMSGAVSIPAEAAALGAQPEREIPKLVSPEALKEAMDTAPPERVLELAHLEFSAPEPACGVGPQG